MTKKLLFIAWIVNLLFIYAWSSINIYLPALPSLSKVFSTSDQSIKLSITLFLIGFGLSQLFWGSLSERYGRKIPLLIGVALCCFGVLLSLTATHVFVFNLGRFIESFGIGCASSLGRAILTDSFDKIKLTRMMSYVATSTNLTPFFAPLVGGYIFKWLGWRWIFGFLLIFGLTIFLFFWRYISETHTKINRNLSLKDALTQYKNVIKKSQFWGYLLPYAFLAGGTLGYYAVAPFIFVQQLHISANVYSYLLATTVIGYCLGSALTRTLAPRLGIDKVFFIGLLFSLSSALLATILAFTASLNIVTVLVPAIVFMFSTGIVSPNANTGAMLSVSHIAGAGGAIMAASLYAASALLSGIITAVNINSLTPLALYTSSIALIALISFVAFRTKPN